MNATPKEDRSSAFYADAFTESTTWGPGIFETACEEHGITAEDGEFFGHTASRLWETYSEAERAEFAVDYDDWLDA
jgi:hypothetical protein